VRAAQPGSCRGRYYTARQPGAKPTPPTLAFEVLNTATIASGDTFDLMADCLV
jgi:hypothetical protein